MKASVAVRGAFDPSIAWRFSDLEAFDRFYKSGALDGVRALLLGGSVARSVLNRGVLRSLDALESLWVEGAVMDVGRFAPSLSAWRSTLRSHHRATPPRSLRSRR